MKKLILISTFILISACSGGGGSESSSTIEPPPSNTTPVANAGSDQNVTTTTVVTLDGSISSDADNNSLSYSWTLTTLPDNSNASLSDGTDASATFTADLDGTYVVQLIVNDGSVNSTPDTVTIIAETAPVANDVAFNLPTVIGSGCEFNAEIINTYTSDIASMSWYVLSDTNELISEGNAIENNSITLTIPNSGNYSLSATTIFTNGLTSETSDAIIVNKALPKDIKSIDYVIESGQSQVVCQDVNIWNDATLTLKQGTNLSSVDDYSKKILMWGNVNIAGEKESRVSISNVIFENNFLTTDSTILVNATYADFINDATIVNYKGTTNISFSSFDSHFNQEDQGTLRYNVFNKGLSIKPDGTIIKNNDIHCEGLSTCMRVSFYMFGSGFIYAKPTIEYNNFFNAANNSITYGSDSFTNSNIDLRNNHWGGKTLTELNDIFVDANDTPDKAYVFLFDPMLEGEVEHSNTAPIANAGADQNVTTGAVVTLDGSASSDADGDTLSFNWSFVSVPTGSTVTFDSSEIKSPSFTADLAGSYVVTLVVNDGQANSETSDVVISAASPKVRLYTKSGIFGGYNEVSLPYSSSGVVAASIIGANTYTLEEFKILAEGQNFTIINRVADDSSNNVSPYFDGLSSGAVLIDGAEVEFKLVSPLTGGTTTNLSYTFEILETGETFSVTRTFTSN